MPSELEAALAGIDPALGGLQQLAQAPLVPPDPAAQIGAVLGGFGAGFQGKVINPVLLQFQRERQEEMNRQVELLQVQRSVQQLRINKAQLGINLYKDILTDPHVSKDAHAQAVTGWIGALKGLGISVNSAFEHAMSQRRVTLGDLTTIGSALAQGVTPDIIRQQFPELSPSEFQTASNLSQNPQFLRANKLTTPDEQRREAAEARLKDMDLLLKQHGIHGDSQRSQIVLQKALSQFGKPFSELDPSHRQQLLKDTEGMGAPKTTLVKNALAEMGLNPDQVQDPTVIQQALTRHTARVKRDQLDLAADRNQLTAVGGMYRKALLDSQQDFSRLARVESLERDMIRLIKEGRELGMTRNTKFVNAAQQELALWTASGGKGKLTRQADWVRRFGIVDAQFAVVAQAFERITGNRLAQTLATLARGFHPKISDPYDVQKGVVLELHKKLKENRVIATQDLARAQNLYDQVLKLTGTQTHVTIPDEGSVEDVSAVEDR